MLNMNHQKVQRVEVKMWPWNLQCCWNMILHLSMSPKIILFLEFGLVHEICLLPISYFIFGLISGFGLFLFWFVFFFHKGNWNGSNYISVPQKVVLILLKKWQIAVRKQEQAAASGEILSPLLWQQQINVEQDRDLCGNLKLPHLIMAGWLCNSFLCSLSLKWT